MHKIHWLSYDNVFHHDSTKVHFSINKNIPKY